MFFFTSSSTIQGTFTSVTTVWEKTVSTARQRGDSVEFSDWLEDGTENGSLHNSPGYPNKYALVRFKLSDLVSLCLIWTHINFPSLSHLSALLLSLSLRMVCSEHHRPRGMCSCLAIINMSYSRADRQSKAWSHFVFFISLQTSDGEKERPFVFLFTAFKFSLTLENYKTLSDLSVTVKLHCVFERNLLTQVLWVAAQNNAF